MSVDDICEKMNEFDDSVQAVDIVSFQKYPLWFVDSPINFTNPLWRSLFKVIELFSMQQIPSLPHLLSCLREKDQYKGTQIYLA